MSKNLSKLISKCMKGHEPSCKVLYEEFLPYCYGINIRYGVEKQDIKDYIQIIFSEVFRSLMNFDSAKSSFKTWFTRITVNKILEQRRNSSRRITFDYIEEKENTIYYDQETETSIDKEYMFRILSKMPVKLRNVFNMHIVDGYTHKEIAAILGISEGSSRVTLKRGRDWAKKALTQFIETT